MAAPKLAEVLGRKAVDRLAELAVDMALDPQAAASPIGTYQTRVRSSRVEEVRDLMTENGFDARAYHKEAVAKHYAAKRRRYEERRRTA